MYYLENLLYEVWVKPCAGAPADEAAYDFIVPSRLQHRHIVLFFVYAYLVCDFHPFGEQFKQGRVERIDLAAQVVQYLVACRGVRVERQA